MGAAISAEIAYVHSQIDALGTGYTSFCNVNSSINCDAVLSSPWAKLLDVPVAWLAGASYIVLAGLFALLWRRSGDHPWALRAAGVLVVGGFLFSVYMAGISGFVLNTICLLCTSLYAVSIAEAAVLVAVTRRYAKAFPQRSAPFSLRNASAVAAATTVAIAGLAWSSWPTVQALPTDLVTIEDVRRADAKFYNWYLELPVVTDPAALGDGSDDPRPVTIVEFSDYQCGHCRRSHALIKGMLERRSDLVRVVHRNFPLDAKCNEAVPATIHGHACGAAEADVCAGQQGLREAVAQQFFDNQRQLFASNLLRLALRAGVEEAAFQRCMDEHEGLAAIRIDVHAGQRLGITSTPTLYINGRRVQGNFEQEAHYDYAVLIESLAASEPASE